MGVGIGRPFHFQEFEVPQEGRVARFREQIDLIRAFWSQQKVTHHGRFYHLEDANLGIRPVQKPLPIWMGVGHPDAIRRAAKLADGWMGAGGSSTDDFRRAVPLLREALEQAGRDPAASRSPNGSSSRSTKNPKSPGPNCIAGIPRSTTIPAGTDASGIHGTPEQVRERLEEMVAMGANHLLLNPVSRHVEQLDALAEIVGLAPHPV